MQVHAGLRIAVVNVVTGQQTMSLRTNVPDLQHQVFGQFALDIEVVLHRVLRAQMWLELTVKSNRDGIAANQDPVLAAD